MDLVLFGGILCTVVGGLGIFLLGMRYMSEGMQAIAGPRLRRLIGSVTDNRLMAIATGAAVTCIIQSSSVTTVMVVGFVNSGLMTLMQAIGVIFGSNIGTTITGWILTLKISAYGLPLLGITALLYLFARGDRVRYGSMAFMGIGMVFFGLELMSDGLAPMKDDPAMVQWFGAFRADSLDGIMKCVLVGAIFTAGIQSSSAALGITMGLVKTGMIGFDTSVALILGMNIGTTVTALLASIGTNTHAKRAAWSHILFNLIGVLWVIPIFPWYLNVIRFIIPGGAQASTPMDLLPAVAMSHTIFNVINTLVFIPLMSPLARLVTWLIPDRRKQEVYKLEYLNVRLLAHPALGIEQSHKEVVAMGKRVIQMLDTLKQVIAVRPPERREDLEEQIFRGESELDNVQREVTVFLSQLLTDGVSADVMEQGRLQLRMADEYEDISDYVLNALKMYLKLRNNDFDLTPEDLECLLSLHTRVTELIQQVNQAVEDENYPQADILPHLPLDAAGITHEMKDSRRKHLDRLAQGHEANPLRSLMYTDMLNAYRRMRDHTVNIAEVLSGEK